MVKVNVSRTQFSLSIAISVALTHNLRKLNFSQISQRMSESFEYVGPGYLLLYQIHRRNNTECLPVKKINNSDQYPLPSPPYMYPTTGGHA